MRVRRPGDAPGSREDPEQGHRRLDRRWVERLLATGQVLLREPGWIGIAPHLLPRTALRTDAAWFH